LKVSAWYAFREMARKPRRFLSLVAVSAAVMTVMVLIILWMEAEWRADVMPDHEGQYHFSFYNLRESDKDYIRAQPWVQATYDLYLPTDDTAKANEFRVRVTWDEVAHATSHARTVLLSRGLLEREPYAKLYDREYSSQYANLQKSWYGAAEKNGITLEEAAALNARSFILRKLVQNASFLRKTINRYTMQPAFFVMLFMLCMFLGAAITILTLEAYKSNFREYGSLRALGFRRMHIFQINCIQSLSVAAVSVPVAALISYGAVQLYYACTAKYSANAKDVFFTIADYIPLPTLLLLGCFMILSSIGGTLAVCFLYREKSVMSLLRGEGIFLVSFVSKTSEFFERARDIGAYSRLYSLRARASLLRYTAIIAIMLPLPMNYLILAFSMAGTADTPSDTVQLIYNLFQIVAVLITTLCVTISASRMAAAGRASEFAVLRALGADRKTVCAAAYPTATAQGALILILSVFLNAALHSINEPIYIGSTAGAKPLSEILTGILIYALSAALFVLPSVYGGLSMFLHGFLRRPILSSIRESQ